MRPNCAEQTAVDRPCLIVVDMLRHCKTEHAVRGPLSQRHRSHVHVETRRQSADGAGYQRPREEETATLSFVRHHRQLPDPVDVVARSSSMCRHVATFTCRTAEQNLREMAQTDNAN